MKQRKPMNRISAKKLKQLGGRIPASSFKTLKAPGRMKSRKVYVGDVLCDSQWEAEKYTELLWREKAGEITDLQDHLVITFKVYNEAGDFKQFQINIDFQYYDKLLNRPVRYDRKSSKKLVKKTQPDWLIRWDLLRFAEPDYQYELEYMK